MTEFLEKAFRQVSELPPADQDAVAGWLLDELESERRWDESFANSQDLLSEMATEALRDRRSNQSKR